MKKERTNQTWVLFGIILIGLGVRLAYLIHLSSVCRADEAVFGLMTKHLLAGKAFPIYLYGAHYAGALICYLAAPLFFLFGASMPLLKLTTYLFMFPTLLMIYFLTRSLTDSRTAALAALFFAIPPFLINWVGQYAGGGYPETLFFGTSVLLLTHRFLSKNLTPAQEARWMGVLGFLNGVGTWILFAMIPYTVTSWMLIPFKKKHSLRKLSVIFLSSYAIGILPMVIYNIQHPFATFARLGANVMGIERGEVAGREGGALLNLGFSKGILRVLELPKGILQVLRNVWAMMRMESSVGGIAMVWDLLLGFSLCFLLVALLRSMRKNFVKHPLALPFLLVVWMVLFLAGTGLTKMRYVAFMYPALVILLAASILRFSSKQWAWVSLAAVFLSANLVNHFVALRTPESEDRFNGLVQLLETRGLRYGYADYGTAYPIIFLTGERIIVSPAAGPLNVERIPEYTQKVNQAKEVFFVFEKDSQASRHFEELLKARRVSFKREEAGRHSLYDRFSRRITPQDLPLIRLFPAD